MPDEVDVDHAISHEPERGWMTVASMIDSVASIRGVDTAALPPLQGTLDTDALAALLNSAEKATPTLEIEFEYAGCRVTIDGGGSIRIRAVARHD